MTNKELDALERRLVDWPDCDWNRVIQLRKDAAQAVAALRTQLAEVKAEKEKLGRELNLARYGQPDFSWQVHKEALAEANARADRAEAALAALIEEACAVIDTHAEYDQAFCCDGRECGCQGVSVHDTMKRLIRQPLARLKRGGAA